MLVQGVIVRVCVARLGEEATLTLAMVLTSVGYASLSCMKSSFLPSYPRRDALREAGAN